MSEKQRDLMNRGYEKAMIDVLVILGLKKDTPEEALSDLWDYASDYVEKAKGQR